MGNAFTLHNQKTQLLQNITYNGGKRLKDPEHSLGRPGRLRVLSDEDVSYLRPQDSKNSRPSESRTQSGAQGKKHTNQSNGSSGKKSTKMTQGGSNKRQDKGTRGHSNNKLQKRTPGNYKREAVQNSQTSNWDDLSSIYSDRSIADLQDDQLKSKPKVPVVEYEVTGNVGDDTQETQQRSKLRNLFKNRADLIPEIQSAVQDSGLTDPDLDRFKSLSRKQNLDTMEDTIEDSVFLENPNSQNLAGQQKANWSHKKSEHDDLLDSIESGDLTDEEAREILEMYRMRKKSRFQKMESSKESQTQEQASNPSNNVDNTTYTSDNNDNSGINSSSSDNRVYKPSPIVQTDLKVGTNHNIGAEPKSSSKQKLTNGHDLKVDDVDNNSSDLSNGGDQGHQNINELQDTREIEQDNQFGATEQRYEATLDTDQPLKASTGSLNTDTDIGTEIDEIPEADEAESDEDLKQLENYKLQLLGENQEEEVYEDIERMDMDVLTPQGQAEGQGGYGLETDEERRRKLEKDSFNRGEEMLKLINKGFGNLDIQNIQDLFPFKVDKFQKESIQKVLEQNSVVVCAPTGAGKTVIAEAGATIALSKGQQMIYTTPLKALSCQKYLDFKELLGVENVGLVTGDISINPNADITVMTTEILRNIMYRTEPEDILGGKSIAQFRLENVDLVVMDEVHYMGDKDRGFVWEEIIITAPNHLQLLCMSATIKNPSYLSQWISKVHGPCQLIQTSFRPVPLQWFYCYSLKGEGQLNVLLDQDQKLDPKEKLKLNQQILELKQINVAPRKRIGQFYGKIYDQDMIRKKMKELQEDEERRGLPGVPNYGQVLEVLQKKDMLPALIFIFSRKGCDQAVKDVAKLPLTFTTARESLLIDQIIKEHLQEKPDVMRDRQLITALQKGIASHHAGCLPALKFLVERLFKQGLIKVIFATETLAAGINMPARTTVISKLERYTGDGFAELMYNNLLQMAGRAGRRGYDQFGYTVVAQNLMEVTPFKAIDILNRGPEALDSQFQSGYGLVLNLLRNQTLEEARSFISQTYGYFVLEANMIQKAQGYQQNVEKVQQMLSEVGTDISNLKKLGKLNGFDKSRLLTKQREQIQLKNKARVLENRSSSQKAELNKNWELFISVVELLVEVGAVTIQEDDHVITSKVGQIARDLKCSNELWFALAIMNPELDNLSEIHLAGVLCALVSPNYINRETIDTKIEASEEVKQVMEALEPVRKATFQLQERFMLHFPTEVDTRICGLVEAWASGCQWRTLLDMSDLDDGDVCKIITTVTDLLRQIQYIDGLSNVVRSNAQRASSAMSRFPIVDEAYLALLEDKDVQSLGNVKMREYQMNTINAEVLKQQYEERQEKKLQLQQSMENEEQEAIQQEQLK